MAEKTYQPSWSHQLLEFHDLTIEDLEQLVEIERGGYSFPWSERLFRESIGSGYLSFGVWLQDELLGYAISTLVLDEVHLLNLCVHSRFRRQGLARYLLRQLIARAQQSGASKVLLEVRVSNHGALALYASEGFERCGRRPEYYPDPKGREDAQVMLLALGSDSEAPGLL